MLTIRVAARGGDQVRQLQFFAARDFEGFAECDDAGAAFGDGAILTGVLDGERPLHVLAFSVDRVMTGTGFHEHG